MRRPHRGRARERHLRHVGVLGDPLADRAPRPHHHVQHPLRQARIDRDPLQLDRRQGSELGRLQHDRVAGGERRADLPGGDCEREVPGGDQTDHAERLAKGHVDAAGNRDRVSEQALGGAGVVVEHVRHHAHLAAGVRDRLAHVARLEPREPLGVLTHGGGDPAQERRPVGGVTARQAGNAALARAIAASASSGPACGSSAMNSSVAGSRTLTMDDTTTSLPPRDGPLPGQPVPQMACRQDLYTRHGAMSSGPLIGICAVREEASWAFWRQTAHLVADTYVAAVQATGALPVILPVDTRHPSAILERLDGLLAIGGADVDPSSYGAERDPATEGTYPERDAFEIAMIRAAVERDLPFLGICRGMQILNVALGGTPHPEPRGRGGSQPAPAGDREASTAWTTRSSSSRARRRGARGERSCTRPVPPPPGGWASSATGFARRAEHSSTGSRKRSRRRTAPSSWVSSGIRRPPRSVSCSRSSPMPGGPGAARPTGGPARPRLLHQRPDHPRALVLLRMPEHSEGEAPLGELDRLTTSSRPTSRSTTPSPSSSTPWWWWDLTAVSLTPSPTTARAASRPRAAPSGPRRCPGCGGGCSWPTRVGQVLLERAARGHVQHLHPAADPEHRHVALERAVASASSKRSRSGQVPCVWRAAWRRRSGSTSDRPPARSHPPKSRISSGDSATTSSGGSRTATPPAARPRVGAARGCRPPPTRPSGRLDRGADADDRPAARLRVVRSRCTSPSR